MNDIITNTSSVGVSLVVQRWGRTFFRECKVLIAPRRGRRECEPPSVDVPTAEEVFAAADKVTAFLQENNSTRTLRIAMNESLDRAVFTVVDSETNEVVRHIPSDEVIAMAEYIEQWIPDAEDVVPQGILLMG